MDIIIFSKDRAAQLDLCIRSIKEYVFNPKITVLLTWSNQDYLDGYAKLLSKHKGVSYVEQGNFKRTLRRTIKECGKTLVMMVDDSIFIKKLNEIEIRIAERDTKDKRVKCYSLMLSPEIDYCYAKDQRYIPSTLWHDIYVYFFNWAVEADWSDWGYPHQVGGNLWTKEYLLKITKWISFKNPNELECKLNFPLRRRRYSSRWMGCFPDTKILTTPINYIPKKETENRNSGLYTLKELNDKFLDDYQIKLPEGIKTNAICKEIDLGFERC